MNKINILFALCLMSNFTTTHANDGTYCNGGQPLPPMCKCDRGRVSCTFQPPSGLTQDAATTYQQKSLKAFDQTA